MEQIIKPNSRIMDILGKAKPSTSGYRMLKYCMTRQVDEGMLLFNVLTRELVLLTPEEYDRVLESEYLREHWFVVPEGMDERKTVDMVRWVRKTIEKQPKHITNYTILTTTDCNARCFYCYEMGRARTPMSEETASKTADFIIENCGGEKVRITWFGGEPLYNYPAIDRISEKLRAGGIEFDSVMISNGYLFNDELIAKAAGSWNLKRVQITLDGTEEVYNRAKAFIHRDGSAYRIVTGNIARLLEAGIRVNVRMNMDFYNAEDLLKLSDELAQRFAGQEGLKVYAHLIFDEKISWDHRYTREKWTQLYDAKHRLEERLLERGLASTGAFGLKRDLPLGYCMADNPSAVVIVPDGHLGRCEHYSESEFIGHLDSPERDQKVIASWQERFDALPECADCFCYPQCIGLKKCPDRIPCFEPERNAIRQRGEQAMIVEYRRWKEHGASESGEDTVVECP